MTTFKQVKLKAYTMSRNQLLCGKQYASLPQDFGAFWLFDSAESFSIMLESQDKLFWWRLAVKAMRFSNDFYRRNSAQNTPTSL